MFWVSPENEELLRGFRNLFWFQFNLLNSYKTRLSIETFIIGFLFHFGFNLIETLKCKFSS